MWYTIKPKNLDKRCWNIIGKHTLPCFFVQIHCHDHTQSKFDIVDELVIVWHLMFVFQSKVLQDWSQEPFLLDELLVVQNF